jgi:hypothetical protein
MLKEKLERGILKGTRSQEGIKPSVDRYRFNEIICSANVSGALTLRPGVEVAIERLSPQCRDKIKTFLQTREAEPTEISPFADIAFGIRMIHSGRGPLRIEATGDEFDKIPWVLTVTILEDAMKWTYRGMEKIVYVPTKTGPKRMKDVGLFYHDEKPVAVMYPLRPCNVWKRILVKWLENERQILVEYKPAGRSDGGSRLGYRYFVDYVMFSSSSVKQSAIRTLSSKGKEFSDKYEPTLAQTKKLILSRND